MKKKTLTNNIHKLADKNFVRTLAHHTVRNSNLEQLHSGTSPSSKTGDYSDVKVITPYGEIPWKQVSRITDIELRTYMLDVEAKMLTFFKQLPSLMKQTESDDRFLEVLAEAWKNGISWDSRNLDGKLDENGKWIGEKPWEVKNG